MMVDGYSTAAAQEKGRTRTLNARCLVLVSVEFQERSKRNNLLDTGKQAIRRNKTWPSKQPFYGLCHPFDILNANTQ